MTSEMSRNPGGRPPIHAAFESCSTGRIAELVRDGADVDAPDSRGDTVLHRLVERFQSWPEELMLEMAKALIEGGASLEVRDSKGRTPLVLLHEARERLLGDDPREDEGEWRMAMDDLLVLYEGHPLPRRGM